VGAGSETPLDVTLAVSQQDAGLSSAFYPAGETAIGHPVLDSNGQLIPGFGHFAADDFQSGGFDSLTLKGTVEFQGPVSITANRSITLADAGVIYADSSVYLTAPYISVGMPFQAPQQASQVQTPFQNGEGKPFLFSPTYGSGNLNLQATTLIDIGDLSLQNIGQASFVVNGGDIRGDGTLEMAGNLTLSAGQIYPPTDVGFTIAAFDYTVNTTIQLGSVTIEGGGDRQLPLSAGGTLSVYASEINQDGVLRAPLGAIQLGWDGTGNGPVDLISGATFASTKNLTLGDDSVTSVSAIDPISGKAFVIPYGIDVNGTSWIDPTGRDITDGGVAQKSIQLSGANITVKSGAQIDIRGGGNLYTYRWVSERRHRGHFGLIVKLRYRSDLRVELCSLRSLQSQPRTKRCLRFRRGLRQQQLGRWRPDLSAGKPRITHRNIHSVACPLRAAAGRIPRYTNIGHASQYKVDITGWVEPCIGLHGQQSGPESHHTAVNRRV
jgi:hypothetical protein